jgi:hypothetical protein
LSTIADYEGRTVDLAAFVRVETRRGQFMLQSLASGKSGGFVVAGIQKLAQRFLLKLLNDAGSTFWDSEDGCAFLQDARRGRWRTVADVQQSFASALLDVKRQLLAEETDDDPNDERFSSASLTNVVIGDLSVSVRVSLTSLAGTTYAFLTPIPVLPR